MFGCHNCEQRPEAGTPYEETPCAQCITGRNQPPEARTKEDPATYQTLFVLHPSMEEDYECGEDIPQTSHCVQDAVRQQVGGVLRALAGTVRFLVELKENYPQTYRIVDAKLFQPELSYTDLAERFCCRKQNIQYHLKKAVELCPELSDALMIDSRYSMGYNAIRVHAANMAAAQRRSHKGAQAR